MGDAGVPHPRSACNMFAVGLWNILLLARHATACERAWNSCCSPMGGLGRISGVAVPAARRARTAIVQAGVGRPTCGGNWAPRRETVLFVLAYALLWRTALKALWRA